MATTVNAATGEQAKASATQVKAKATVKASAQPKERVPEPCAMVIFGASGDLTSRKLLPALFHLQQAKLLPENFAIVGAARRDISATFADDMKKAITESDGIDANDAGLKEFASKISYVPMAFDDDSGYDKLKQHLADIDKKFGTEGNRLFYLAVSPQYFADIIDRLGKHGMNKPEKDGQFRRVVIEKPYGHDLQSAIALSDNINKVFAEDQVFRIDHYLGKETVQNILVFRFANGMFEPVWNRNYIDNVQITAAESIGIEGRGAFYEKAGALRDVVQNHVMELLSYVAMEPPNAFAAQPMHNEQLKVWRAVLPIKGEDTVRGQYGPGTVDGQKVPGYREEKDVNPQSQTETFAAMKLQIENWRWAGVPFYLRAGKRLATRVTEITVEFKQPPLLLFDNAQGANCGEMQPNIISMRIQPDEGISLRFMGKSPGTTMSVCPVHMDFSYAEAFGKSSANGYERLLIDVMLGDGTLFAHRMGEEALWTIVDPVLDAWAKQKMDFPNYAAGSYGPKDVDALLAKDGRSWHSL